MQPSEKRKFGHSGLEVTALGFGALQVGNFFHAVSDAESDDMFRTAWEAGVRYFDTAPYYGHGRTVARYIFSGMSPRARRRSAAC